MSSKPKSNSRVSAARVSILAFLPLLAIGLLFLANAYAWEFMAVDYGMLNIFIVVFVSLFVIYLLVEIARRARRTSWIERLPWFSLVVAGALSTFFYVGKWATPFVMQVPNWCRVSQTVRGESANNGWFVLVLHGRGNKEHYEFRRGYLNCGVGEDRGGVDIKFNPIKFGWWEGYNHVFVDASPSELRRHIDQLDYTANDSDTMSTEIWKILDQAVQGNPLSSQKYVVEPIWDTPNHEAHHKLGCLIWLALSSIAFVVAGQFTVTQQPLKPAT